MKMSAKSHRELKKELTDVKRTQKNLKDFAPLYEKYYPKIKTYFYYRVNRDYQITNDLTSLTFEKVLKNIKSYRWQGISFSAWIYRIAHNTLIDYYRKQNSQKNRRKLHENIQSDYLDNESLLIRLDDASRINGAIRKLNKAEQEIIRLKFYDGLTNKKIATLVHKSESNVGTIIHRVMRKFRESLTK